MPKMAKADNNNTLYNKIESIETERIFCRIKMGRLMGLEPTTTEITTRGSTN